MQRVALFLPEPPFARADQILAAGQGLPGLIIASEIQVQARESKVDPRILQAGLGLQLSARDIGVREGLAGKQLRSERSLIRRLRLILRTFRRHVAQRSLGLAAAAKEIGQHFSSLIQPEITRLLIDLEVEGSAP